jgi:hypothetical protein
MAEPNSTGTMEGLVRVDWLFTFVSVSKDGASPTISYIRPCWVDGWLTVHLAVYGLAARLAAFARMASFPH